MYFKETGTFLILDWKFSVLMPIGISDEDERTSDGFISDVSVVSNDNGFSNKIQKLKKKIIKRAWWRSFTTRNPYFSHFGSTFRG